MSTEHVKYKVRKDPMSTMAPETEMMIKSYNKMFLRRKYFKKVVFYKKKKEKTI